MRLLRLLPSAISLATRAAIVLVALVAATRPAPACPAAHHGSLAPLRVELAQLRATADVLRALW